MKMWEFPSVRGCRGRGGARWVAVAWLASILACAPADSPGSTGAASPQRVSASTGATDAQALEKFRTSADAYASLHRKLEATLPDLPAETEPEVVDAHQLALQKLIATARAGAKQGDVIVADVQPVIRRIVREALTGADGPAMLAVIKEEAAERTISARVNEPYPVSVPVSSVPSRLLNALPRLPGKIEYRFLGADLILLDRDARLVVDVLPDVLPR